MSEHNVPSIIGCNDAPIFSTADIFQTLTSCEECEALCWQVVDCEDPENILCTSEQSGANPNEWAVLTGKIIRFQDINDDNKEKCGFVTQGRCIDLSCDFINIPVVECFDDCDSCKVIPEEITFNFTQRSVYPGYNTPACTPEVYDKTLKRYATPEVIIDLYFKQKYHNTFNEWFEEFLDITKITNFDKDKGVDFYKFPNNNTIMIYTMEKLTANDKYIKEQLGIVSDIKNKNNSDYRNYSKIYKQVKQKIVYKKEYLDNLLNTDIMHLFYNENDINFFYSKYKTL